MAQRRKMDWRAAGIGVVILAGVFSLFEAFPRELGEIEEQVFDQYQRWKPRAYLVENPEAPGEMVSPPVRVIDIDETSLGELGQWPWPRTFLAEMTHRLYAAGAAVVIFDVAFTEPDRTSPHVLAETLPRFGDDYGTMFDQVGGKRGTGAGTAPNHDEAFAAVLSQVPSVLGVIPSDDPGDRKVPIKQAVTVLGPPGLEPVLTDWPYAINALPVLGDAASGVGMISLARDEGQIIRRVPLIQRVGGELYPVLSIEGMRVAFQSGSIKMKTTRWQDQWDFSEGVAVSSIKVGPFIVPLDADGTLRVRYSGAEHERVIPAHRLLQVDGVPEDVVNEITGRIIIIGSSAPTLFDVKTTPLSPRISGVHVHAELMEQILANEYLTRPDWEVGLGRLIMIIAGVCVIVLLALNMPLIGFGALLLGATVIAGTSWYMFSDQSLLFSPVGPLMGLFLPYFGVSGFKYFVSEAGRREVTRQFEHFVSPEVIADIIDDPDSHLTPGGAQRELSIMFLDVRRFSTITEKMEPQEVIAFINKLLTPLTDVIIDNQGTIDKYMGDAVMAFWNAPRETEGHEIKAINAMLAFNPIMEELNADFAAQGLPDIGIGVGINTGLCSVGNMGSIKRLAYSCVGDSVNLASRLEGQTKAYGVGNLIGARTAEGARGYALIELDSVAVKGRTQPETIYTVAGGPEIAAAPAFVAVQKQLIGARAAYLGQQWDAAEAAFRGAAGMPGAGAFDPAPLCAIMIDRIDQYRADPPPPDWDGVYVATSK